MARRYFNQEDVTKYAQANAREKRWSKVCKELRQKFIEQYNKGFRCPLTGPYILDITNQQRPNITWLEEYEKVVKVLTQLAQARYGDNWRKRIGFPVGRQRVLAKAEKIPIPTLLPRVNPRYRSRESELGRKKAA